MKKVTSQANCALGLVRRNLSSCPRPVKVQMYQALVRPHLEYAATAWDPYHLNNINSLERRSARFVTGNYNRTPGTVTRILSDLQWPTLQRRRQDARLYLLYRSIQGNIAVSLPSYITKQTRTTRHTHPQIFLQVRASTQTYQNSFFPRTVRDWNDLPPDILEAPTAALSQDTTAGLSPTTQQSRNLWYAYWGKTVNSNGQTLVRTLLRHCARFS